MCLQESAGPTTVVWLMMLVMGCTVRTLSRLLHGGIQMKNRITELLRIRHPIALGGMAGVTYAPLAAAVSEAGGLGTLGAFKETAESLQQQIRQLNALTQKPYAVNVPLVVPQAPELISVVLENRVPVVVTAAGNPATYTKKLRNAGIRVLHVVPCVDQARRAEEAGVDALIAEGCESGGFGSPFEIGTIVLVPQVVDAVRQELVIEAAIVATEFEDWNPEVYADVVGRLPVTPTTQPHVELVEDMAKRAYAYVKTGECSAYSSVALVCGVNYLDEAVELYTRLHPDRPSPF